VTDASPDTENKAAPALTPARIVLIAVAVLVAAIASYWLFIRETYTPVLRSLSPEVAADVVKVLDDKKITYRLADGGTTVLVPSAEADKARLELVGSELPMRGQVGFELFDQSDMGLTEFAQKINYQRALQGELARTILMLDGIQSVRVHLGLAERGLFRNEQSRPKASVALVLTPGTALTERRVSGIQRLVAGAVPELAPDTVAVLDETGRIVSAAEIGPALALTTNEARLNLYRANILSALRESHPGTEFGVTISLQVDPGAAASVIPLSPDATSPDNGSGDVVRIIITTSARLEEEVRSRAAQAIRQALGTGVRISVLSFLVGDPTIQQTDGTVIGPAVPDKVVAQSTRGPTAPFADDGPSLWWLLVPLALAAIGLALWSDRRRRMRTREGLASFTQQLRERLASSPEAVA
jgi:flagellar M-ring protein FliF